MLPMTRKNVDNSDTENSHQYNSYIKPRSQVLLLPTPKPISTHELVTHEVLGRMIAKLLFANFGGIYGAAHATRGSLYLIPNDTLVGKENWSPIGIRHDTDFFGGLVEEPFMATKAISHSLFTPDSYAPTGWNNSFSNITNDAVLKGFTAFSLEDALKAGTALLKQGPCRIKPVRATAGRGQTVISNTDELHASLSTLNEKEIALWGLTLEENLSDVTTYSVGQVIIAGITASYVGVQHLTKDNNGVSVYGGSDLLVVRGNYGTLFKLPIAENARLAISQARLYEHAAFSAYPGLVASRRNYDVAQGINCEGKFCSGVLEQSWRIGGASGAEIFAVNAFCEQPELHSIRACTHEVYGDFVLPSETTLLYQGDDPEVGRITKYVKVEPYVHTN